MRIAPELPTANTGEGFAANGGASAGRAVQLGTHSANAQAFVPEEVQPAGQGHEPALQSLTLSFKKDPAGRTYYVILDSQTGQVVREVPPEEVRQVGEGIEAYLKAQEALAARRTDTKA